MLEIHWLDKLTYEDGLKLQDETMQKVRSGQATDTLLLLEHEPVYTIGHTQDRSSLRSDTLPHPVHTINRGGQATYHGPGQLVAYPILNLTEIQRDLHRYLRFLEKAILQTAADFGLTANLSEGFTGVWIENRKMVSIGVGVRQWISMHGMAWNITPESLSGFTAITPCGIGGVQMTCLANEVKKEISVRQVGDAFSANFRQGHAEAKSAGNFEAAFSLHESEQTRDETALRKSEAPGAAAP
ncbi:MAG: lipoyl(octanoyl) transferase LipB [Chthoniobacterales bacterium]